MALIVGDLLTDPAAQSFISLDDADAYLGPEQHEAWALAYGDQKEAALVRASRWLAGSFAFAPLGNAGLTQLGRVAARLASETMNRPIFAGTETGKQIKTATAGSASITYMDGVRADAAGMAWPWLRPMLSGLVLERGVGIGAIVV